jgi:monoamine oxidase
MLNHNTDLLTGWLSFYKAKTGLYSERVLERVHFELMMEGLTSGADIRELSAKEFINNREKTTSDYLPKGGYFALLKAIFDQYCGKATVKYETVVTEVDYSTPIVKVKTSKGEVYYAKRVISSLPLGVLKAGDVKFTPPLPAGHQEAIQKIGNGVFNKVIVSFTDYFWTKGVKVLDFIPLYSEQDTSKKFL